MCVDRPLCACSVIMKTRYTSSRRRTEPQSTVFHARYHAMSAARRYSMRVATQSSRTRRPSGSKTVRFRSTSSPLRIYSTVNGEKSRTYRLVECVNLHLHCDLASWIYPTVFRNGPATRATASCCKKWTMMKGTSPLQRSPTVQGCMRLFQNLAQIQRQAERMLQSGERRSGSPAGMST